MGGEMIYILEQRLHAQSIPADKSQKVLSDIVRYLFDSSFVAEVFKPQELYTVRATRSVFERLAHASIMRLNESSMDKLFDLMRMGVKYQTLAIRYPRELYEVATNHLEALRKIVSSHADVVKLIDSFEEQFSKRYSRLQDGEYGQIRQALLDFFLDTNVKVSLFLQEGLQLSTGRLVLPLATPLPPSTAVPGTIRYFANGSTAPVLTSEFRYCGVQAAAAVSNYKTDIGLNLYAKTQTKIITATPSPPTQPSMSATLPEPPNQKLQPKVSAELNLLASLIRPPKAAANSKIKIANLFQGSEWIEDSAHPAKSDVKPHVLEITGQPTNEVLSNIMRSLSVAESTTDSTAKDGGDLLALLDSAV